MRLTGGEALVQQLILEGAKDVIGVPGVQLDWAVDALRKAKNEIGYYVPRHEQATSFMADGYARASGRMGVCMMVPGPGVLNAGAGLATAYACSSRVLCIAGHIHSDGIGKGHGLLHEIKDQGVVLDQVTKWRGQASAPEEVPGLVREAVKAMNGGRPGPVAVEVPHNVLSASGEVELIRPPAGEDMRLKPDPAQIDRIARIIDAASFPVVYAGGGVLAAMGGPAALLAFAELLGAPVVASENARGVISDRHALSFSTLAARALLPHADVVIVVGSRFMETRGPVASWDHQATKYIYINADERAADPPRVPGMFMQADAALALVALADAIAAKPAAHRRILAADRAAALKAWAQARIDAIEPQAGFIRALRAAIPEDGILVNELTQVGYLARVGYPTWAPGTHVSPGYQGTLGYGFPTGLGMAVAKRDRPVVSITGDGGFGWTLQDLATAARYKLGHVTVVFADGYFGNVRTLQKDQFGEAYQADLANPDFVRLADSFGVPGTRVSDANGLEGALSEAIRGGGPALIEVKVGEMPSPWGLLRLKAPGAAGSPEPPPPPLFGA